MRDLPVIDAESATRSWAKLHLDSYRRTLGPDRWQAAKEQLIALAANLAEAERAKLSGHLADHVADYRQRHGFTDRHTLAVDGRIPPPLGTPLEVPAKDLLTVRMGARFFAADGTELADVCVKVIPPDGAATMQPYTTWSV